jgi:hypothetical protein
LSIERQGALKHNELRKALNLIEEHKEEFLVKWYNYFSGNDA